MRCFKDCGIEKNEIAKRCWEDHDSFNWDKERLIRSWSIHRKIKDTIHFFRNAYHIDNMSSQFSSTIQRN